MEAEATGGIGRQPWLAHYPPEIPARLDYPSITLPELLHRTVKDYPERIAVHFLGKEISFTKLWDLAVRFADNLRRQGILPGDRVAIMLPNCPQTVIAYYGTLLAGAVVVYTNPLYVERELNFQLRDSGAKVLVALDVLYQRVMGGIAGTVVEKVFFTAIEEQLPFPKNLLYPFKKRREGQHVSIPWQKGRVSPFRVLLEGKAKEPPPTGRKAEDLAQLQYTGGTTGTPKGVMLTHRNLVVNTIQTAAWFYACERGKEIFLCALPFFHVYGMTTALNHAAYIGATMVLIPRFDAKMVLQAIQRESVTFFPGAPTMYVAVLNHPEGTKYDLSSIKACISGAAPMPVEVLRGFEEVTGSWLAEGYGLTEASPVTHCTPLGSHRRKVGSIGLPFPDTDCRIVDPETRLEVPVGEVGELAVRGPQVMQGYWNRPEETAKTLDDGWLYTGDLARMDEEGYFYIVDRKKDLIIAGGYNIYPREVEEVLYEHPKVMEAVVVGAPDPYRGETVKAYVVLKAGVTVEAGEILAFCKERLAPYKVPKLLEFRGELPKTLSGKILRRVLRDGEGKGDGQGHLRQPG